MKGAFILLGTLILSLISACQCQITFSRSWVRGKLPGEKKMEGGDYDEVKEIPSSFLRQAKAPIDYLRINSKNEIPYSRDPKALRGLRTKLLHDIFLRLRPAI